LLHCILDLPLVALQVDNENESIVILDLLHGRLRAQGRYDGAELVHPWGMCHGLSLVFGVTRKAEGLGPMERGIETGLALFGRMNAFESCLLCCLGLRLFALCVLGGWSYDKYDIGSCSIGMFVCNLTFGSCLAFWSLRGAGHFGVSSQ